MNCVLIHYGEIVLKGNNRGDFENQLVANIKAVTSEHNVEKIPGRMLLYPKNLTNEALAEKLSKVFGIVWFAFSTQCPSTFEEIKRTTLEMPVIGTFKIDSSRVGSFTLSSQELNAELGNVVRLKHNAIVLLSNPDTTIFVEVTEKQAFIFTEKIKGPGGLPVGSSGKVLCLFSGGIDSPVAAWMLMKRGCIVDFLHVHSLRSNEEVKKTKVYRLFETLKLYSPSSHLFAVPFHVFDVAVQALPSKLHLILFKKYLLALADVFAKEKYGAVITGDSLGQVASQTLESLNAVSFTNKQVFRPLIGFDKEEIITLAKKIGTYENSICDYKDCCAIVAKHPATKPKQEVVDELSKEMQLEKIVKKTLENVGQLS